MMNGIFILQIFVEFDIFVLRPLVDLLNTHSRPSAIITKYVGAQKNIY